MEHSFKLEMGVKKKLSPFTFSRQRKGGSFHVVVLQIYAKIFTKIFHPRTQPLFYSLNVLFRVVPVTVVTFLNCLVSRCNQDGSWNNKSFSSLLKLSNKHQSHAPYILPFLETKETKIEKKLGPIPNKHPFSNKRSSLKYQK